MHIKDDFIKSWVYKKLVMHLHTLFLLKDFLSRLMDDCLLGLTTEEGVELVLLADSN